MSGAAGVRVSFDADRPGQWSAPAEVVWSDGATDVAVPAFTPPAGAEPVGPAPVGRIGERRRDAEGRQFRESHQADATVAALSNLRAGTLEVTAPGAAADPDPHVGLCPVGGVSHRRGDREHHRLEQGQWSGQTRAPLPSAIVNLSTRASGVTP
ncbi:hypothetical protein [Streptomyces goshikiensis]|uniref:hypothetical protein n=1 Tax=Streptomyces goshikiensis TaxID=1942 RepID=UPI0036C2D5E6